MKYLNKLLKFIVSVFESPISAGIISFFVYALIATNRGSITGTSSSPYFNYLADAFLHGQLSLRLLPVNHHDLAFFNGQYFLYWPPFPAILLMPFVAIFGIGFSDIFFTLVISSINVGLVAYALRLLNRLEIAQIDDFSRSLLTLFFAFGTVHLFLSSLGNVWFTSQIVSFLCSILVILAVIRLKGIPAFFFAGLFISFALLTRNHLIFIGIWPVYYLYQSYKSFTKRKIIFHFLVALSPIFIAVVLTALYNNLRFGNVLEYGLSYQDFGDFFGPDFQKFGHFNIHYLTTNFFYNFIFYPFPASAKTLMGGSLFLLSPLFFASLWAFKNPGSRRSAFFLWITILVIAIPILLNIGTGWKTFGPRYTLDFTLPLIFLTAIGFRNWPKWLGTLFVLISIIHYIIGTLYFIRIT